jgi:hypothetical protein
VGRPFEPHLTLLRDPKAVADQVIAPVRWKARELVLTESHYGLGRHVPLARIALVSA